MKTKSPQTPSSTTFLLRFSYYDTRSHYLSIFNNTVWMQDLSDIIVHAWSSNQCQFSLLSGVPPMIFKVLQVSVFSDTISTQCVIVSTHFWAPHWPITIYLFFLVLSKKSNHALKLSTTSSVWWVPPWWCCSLVFSNFLLAVKYT